ncbi:MAG: hypothetical protein M1832_004714 [Thelocarpon impressellum]|nr:MAG: hypothetical protein M1832_004714 [Thelocarpon impressellum]
MDGQPSQQQDDAALQHSRSRSSTSVSTKGKRRPQSRASTTSVHSFTTQHSQQQPAPDMQYAYPQPQQQGRLDAYHVTAEGMMLHASQQLTGPHGFPLDPTLEGHAHHLHAMPLAAAAGNSYPVPMTGNPELDYPAYHNPEDPIVDTGNDVDGGQETPENGADVKGVEKPSKKASTSSAQNDLELKRLFRQNEGKSLQDIAGQLQGNERGPQSEKTRQIFAMLWLNVACKKSSGSVPRGRVYGHYVSRCGTERVTVLNPASFGKLVRVMFPQIQTRRLGMRGESKYHYCGLSLQEDQPNLVGDPNGPNKENNLQLTNFSTPHIIQRGQTPIAELPAGAAVLPSPILAASTTSRKNGSKARDSTSLGSLFWDPNSTDFDFNESPFGSGMIERELRFPGSSPETTFRENEPIDLPNITLYLPPGTDQDTAAALTALYRSNCTSLIDCVRFCREKAFFHFFTSFHGTLTLPVQKLLANPAVAPWIKECDWLMYQKMVRVVAPLTLQVVPKPVVDFLKAISKKLCAHIKTSFQSHPAHVVEAKLGPATIFASLLDRTLRVNLAAHAAANILCNDANRDQMYEEWVLHVETVKIVQNELPNCGYSEVLHVLNSEIRALLEPLNVSWEVDGGSGANDGFSRGQDPASASTEGVLDRWTNFLSSLPERFPKADARTIIGCVNNVATAALRDITMHGGKSFGSWWITKLWLDEMLAWIAEKGGFMDHTPPSNPQGASGGSLAADLQCMQGNIGTGSGSGSGSRPRSASRFSSGDDDFARSRQFGRTEHLETGEAERGGSHGHGIDNSNMLLIHGGNVPPDLHKAQRGGSGGRLDLHNAEHGGSHGNGVDHATMHLVDGPVFSKITELGEHDDSGVGMPMADEELPMGKFGFGPAHEGEVNDSRVALGDAAGVDPGSDVVVC